MFTGHCFHFEAQDTIWVKELRKVHRRGWMCQKYIKNPSANDNASCVLSENIYQTRVRTSFLNPANYGYIKSAD